MKIITLPNPQLREPSKVYGGKFDLELQKYISSMFQEMKNSKGIGLASPQVGRNVRIITIELKDRKYAMINPKIIKRSQDKIEVEEGCLSVPNTWGKVIRDDKIKVIFKNQFGKKISLKAEDLLSAVIQHEIDHLDGILFIDRADPKTITHKEPSSKTKNV